MHCMDKTYAIAEIDRRAFEARLTAIELCAAAKVHPVSWSRAKKRNRISVKTLRLMEDALSRIESERAAKDKEAIS